MTDNNDVLEGLNAVEEVLDGLWAKASATVDLLFTTGLAWVDARRQEVLDESNGGEVDLNDLGGIEDEPSLQHMLDAIREKAAFFLGKRTPWDNWTPSGVEDENLIKEVYTFVKQGFWDVPVKDIES